MLSASADAKGRPLTIVKLPLPPVLHMTEAEARGVQVRTRLCHGTSWDGDGVQKLKALAGGLLVMSFDSVCFGSSQYISGKATFFHSD